MYLARAVAFSSLLSAALVAQGPANDWAGILMRSSNPTGPTSGQVASAISCGVPQSCTPLQLNAFQGETVSFFVMGQFQSFYVLAASFDVPLLGCIPLGVPGLANNLILFPGSLITVTVGTCTVPDNGRCNGGASPSTTLFQVPLGIAPGQVAFQAAVGSPLSTGGSGLALSHAIVMNWQ